MDMDGGHDVAVTVSSANFSAKATSGIWVS